MVVKAQSSQAVVTAEGMQRKILAHDGSLMAVEFTFRKGAAGALHSHPHEQIGYIVKGRFELEIEGRKDIITAGDSYYVAPGVPHGVVALEDSVILDVFNPQRQDFLG